MDKHSLAFEFAKLRLSGEKLDPEKITALLGRTPTYGSAAHDIEFHTMPPVHVHRPGIWELESSGRVFSKDAEEHIRWLIALLDRTRQDAIDLPGVEGAEIWVVCPSHHDGAPGFSPAVLGDLVRHCLTLRFFCPPSAKQHAPTGLKG